MRTRRHLLKTGLAAWALPIAARAGIAPLGPPEAAVPIYKMLYDTRFAASVAFSERAAARGLAVHGIDGDVTRVWYDDLDLRWRREAAAIAGLTAHGALFCLERLAWDHGLRVVYRGEHSASARGVEHRLDGPAPMLSAAANAEPQLAWCAALVDVVAECPRNRMAPRTATFVTSPGGLAPAAEPLFSWVIAPVARS